MPDDSLGSILVEVAERQGGSQAWWIAQSAAYVLWTYCQLQELDRRRAFIARMHRFENADLMRKAFHDPNSLPLEHRAALAEAGAPVEDVLAHGERMRMELGIGQVLVS